MHRLTLKEFAYLHFRSNGLPPARALEVTRVAITTSAVNNRLFEECVNIACAFLAMPRAFSGVCIAA